MKVSLRDALTCIQIGGKPVVLFEKHHFALLPWHDWAGLLPSPPRLLSLDAHTDSMLAFRGYACATVGRSRDWHVTAENARTRRLSRFIGTNPIAVEAAVRDLRHDEHIDVALRAGILDAAFVVSRDCEDCLRSNEQIALDREWAKQNPPEKDDSVIGGTISVGIPPIAAPPFSYTLPANRLVILDDRDAWADEASRRQWRDSLLESAFLQGRLELIDRICMSAGVPCLFERPFILDIDLDAFNTRRAINPADATVFYDLVRRAVGVTVAREPGYVEQCQFEGEELTAEWLEDALLAHLKAALDG